MNAAMARGATRRSSPTPVIRVQEQAPVEGLAHVSAPSATEGVQSPVLSPTGENAQDFDSDVVHQAVLQFFRRRPPGVQPLVRLAPGMYMYAGKKLALVLRNGRLQVRCGNSFVALSDALLAGPTFVGATFPPAATPTLMK
mmetsp:Transcript_66441/g.185162  ORF Transcript_66441/g.185162 Transcript_66441/m.185162 type:complete len:141 (+) Transcript_66441:1-423(+)